MKPLPLIPRLMCISIAVGAVLGVLSNTAPAQSLITTVSIQSVSSEYPGIEATHLLTPDGFGPGTPATFTNLYTPADIWQTQPFQTQGTNWVIFDLGATYDLASFHVWNLNFHNGATNYTGRGISSMTVLTSTDGSNFTGQGSVNLSQGTDSTSYSGEDFNAPWANVRFVKFANLYSFQNGSDDAGHMGLSKVQFTAVPEPSCLALMLAPLLLGLTRLRPGSTGESC